MLQIACNCSVFLDNSKWRCWWSAEGLAGAEIGARADVPTGMSYFMPCPQMSTRIWTFFFSSPGFVWTEALNHVILLLFVLVVISHAPNSMQPQCFFRADNSKWRCWWSAEGRKVSREQKLGLERTCQLACHTSCYVHTNMNIFFFQSWICVNRGLKPCHFVVVCFSGCFNSETLSLPSSS